MIQKAVYYSAMGVVCHEKGSLARPGHFFTAYAE